MTKHPLLFVALLSLLSVVAALIILHFSPGEQGGQLEGVAITQVSVLEEDGGEIPLSDGLSRRLVALLRQYDRLSYSALPSYTPQPGDLLLTSPNHGTRFYLNPGAGQPRRLFRRCQAVCRRRLPGRGPGLRPVAARLSCLSKPLNFPTKIPLLGASRGIFVSVCMKFSGTAPSWAARSPVWPPCGHTRWGCGGSGCCCPPHRLPDSPSPGDSSGRTGWTTRSRRHPKASSP